MTAPRRRRTSTGSRDDIPPNLAKYFTYCDGESHALIPLQHGMDSFRIARGEFGPELEFYRAAVAHFGDDLPFWARARCRLEELEAQT